MPHPQYWGTVTRGPTLRNPKLSRVWPVTTLMITAAEALLRDSVFAGALMTNTAGSDQYPGRFILGRAPRQGVAERRRTRLRHLYYGLSAVFIGVLLPLVLGGTDTSAPMSQFCNEIAVVAASVWLFAAALLVIAAFVGNRERELLLALAVLSLLVAHPMLDQFDPLATDASRAARQVLAAVTLTTLATTFRAFGRTERVVAGIVAGVAISTIASWTLELGWGLSWADDSATVMVGLGGALCGVLTLFLGHRHADGAAVAVGLGALSVGYGQLLGLLERPGLAVTSLGAVTAVLSAAAALLAVIQASNRREQQREAADLAHARQLARLSAQSDRFAEVAHDHNSALLAIEAAAATFSDHPSGELAAVVAAESQRLRRQLSGATQGADHFELGAVIEPIVRCLEPLHGPIETAVEPETWVVGYPDRVAHVLRSLLDNAHDHGRAPVRIDARLDHATVTISVTDSGPGVPEAYREAIFDRGVTTAPRSHSGLGLYSARRLARDSGGDLRVGADDATFELTLPIDPPVID